ncbi:hypothetical protein AcW1_009828 [Taiwanofungus camphoratus]|nr:hypothetical protein AcW1_009828 [Antrodia cinnamomea]
MTVHNITSGSMFRDDIDRSGVQIVLFFDPRKSQSVKMMRSFRYLSDRYDGAFGCRAVDVWNFPRLQSMERIRYTPTFVVYQRGRARDDLDRASEYELRMLMDRWARDDY